MSLPAPIVDDPADAGARRDRHYAYANRKIVELRAATRPDEIRILRAAGEPARARLRGEGSADLAASIESFMDQREGDTIICPGPWFSACLARASQSQARGEQSPGTTQGA